MKPTTMILNALLVLALASSASAFNRCWCQYPGSIGTARARDVTLFCSAKAGPGGEARAFCETTDLQRTTQERTLGDAGTPAVVSYANDIDDVAFGACCASFGLEPQCDVYPCLVCRCNGSPACRFIPRPRACPAVCRNTGCY